MKVINIYFQVIKYNLKMFRTTIAISVIYAVASLMFFSFKLADPQYIARFVEYYLSVVGILLFAQISTFDKEANVHEIVYSRKISHKTVFIIRIVMAIFINLLILACVLGFAKYEGAKFQYNILLFGGIISSVCLGIIGVFSAALFENKLSAYLIGFGLYFLNYQGGEKALGKLYLFTLTTDNFNAKIKFLAVTLLVAFITYVIVDKRS